MRESSTITSCGTGLDAIAAGDEAVEPSYRIDLPRESAAVERVLPVDTGTVPVPGQYRYIPVRRPPAPLRCCGTRSVWSPFRLVIGIGPNERKPSRPVSDPTQWHSDSQTPYLEPST